MALAGHKNLGLSCAINGIKSFFFFFFLLYSVAKGFVERKKKTPKQQQNVYGWLVPDFISIRAHQS